MDRHRAALALALSLAALAPAPGAQAQTAAAARKPPAAASKLATGEVLEIDRKERRILVKHGPIASIGMDAMTMEFWVPDGRLLKSLRPGDPIRFAVIWRKGEYEITQLEVIARKAAAP